MEAQTPDKRPDHSAPKSRRYTSICIKNQNISFRIFRVHGLHCWPAQKLLADTINTYGKKRKDDHAEIKEKIFFDLMDEANIKNILMYSTLRSEWKRPKCLNKIVF